MQGAAHGGSQITQSSGEMAAAYERAEGQEAQARAEQHRSMEQEEAEYQNSFNDLIKQVQETLRKWNEAMNQANSSIIRNI